MVHGLVPIEDDLDAPPKLAAVENDLDDDGALAAGGRAAANAIVPTLTGLAGGLTGMQTGAAIGAVAGPVGAAVGGLGGLLVGGFLGSYAGSEAQEFVARKVLGDERVDAWKAQIDTDRQAHPYATFAGEAAPAALTMKPSGRGLVEAGKGAFKLAQGVLRGEISQITETQAAHLINVGLGTGTEVANEAWRQYREGNLDMPRLAASVIVGAALNEPNKLGQKLGLKTTDQQLWEDVRARAQRALTEEAPAVEPPPAGPTELGELRPADPAEASGPSKLGEAAEPEARGPVQIEDDLPPVEPAPRPVEPLAEPQQPAPELPVAEPARSGEPSSDPRLGAEPSTTSELPPDNIGALRVAYERAQAAVDELGPEPPKPSSEKKRFGAAGRAGAKPEDVARYNAEVKAHKRWSRERSKRMKAATEAGNALVEAERRASAGEPPPEVAASIPPARGQRIYREASIEEAGRMLPTGRASENGPFPPYRYFTDNPELAIGQGDNRGVVMEFDATSDDNGNVTVGKARLQRHNKPGTNELTGYEYNGPAPAEDIRGALRAVTLKPDAKAHPVDHKRFRFMLDEHLVKRDGWTRTDNPDGSVTYRRPERSGDVSASLAPEHPREAAERALIEEAPDPVAAVGRAMSAALDRDYSAAQGAAAPATPTLPPGAPGSAFGSTPVDVAEIMRRSDIARYMSDGFRLVVGVGRFPRGAMRNALGFYNWRAHYARIRRAKDIETLSHEIGHALDRMVFSGGTKVPGKVTPYDAFKNELLSIASPTLSKRQAPVTEGFAEFVRYYVTDPVVARSKTPGFLTHFEAEMRMKAPELLDVLLSARDKWKQYKRQGAAERIFSNISINEYQHRGISWDDVITAGLDKWLPLKRAVEALYGQEERSGFLGAREPFSNVDARDNPYILGRLLAGWFGKADAFLKWGTFDFERPTVKTGLSLQAILDPVRSQLNEFRTYAVARRTVELSDRGIQTGMSRGDAVAAMAQVRTPQIERAFDQLRSYQKALVKYLVDGQVISPALAKQFEAANRDYVPFFRVFEALERVQSGEGGTSATLGRVNNPIKRMHGDTRDIVDPLESIVKNTVLFVNLAERNELGLSLAKMAKTPNGGQFVRPVPTPIKPTRVFLDEVARATGMDPEELAGLIPEEGFNIFRAATYNKNEPVITVFEKGKAKYYEVNPDIYEAVSTIPRGDLDRAMVVLGAPARALRLGATSLNPAFVATNFTRDQISAFIQSKYGFVPLVDGVRGAFDVLRRSDLSYEFERSGAAAANLVSMDRNYLQNELETMLGERSKGLSHIITSPREAVRALWSAMENLSEASEKASRLGEYRRARARELERLGPGRERELLARAGYAAREVTTDFGGMGRHALVRFFAGTTAFWNARYQGLYKFARTLADNPAGAALKITTAIILPELTLWAWNLDDGRVAEVEDWQRSLFWLVPMKHVSKDEWARMSAEQKAEFNAAYPIAKIPKPFDFGMIFGTFTGRALDWAYNKDPKGLTKAAREFLTQTTEPPFPDLARVPVEIATNYSFFRGRPIVPPALQQLAPEEQKTVFTSPLLVRLARSVADLGGPELSPMKLEHMLRGWTGGLGLDALNGVDAITYSAGIVDLPPRPKRNSTDLYVVNRFFVRYPSVNAKSIDEFYDQYDKTRSAKRTYDTLKKEDPDRAEAFLERNLSDIELSKTLEKGSDKLLAFQRALRGIHADRSLDAEEKRRLIDTMTMEMIDAASTYMEVVREHKRLPEGPLSPP